MNKLSKFLVNQRYILASIFIVLAVISVFLMGQVRINSDITNYLPSDSPTKAGLTIIQTEFDDSASSTLKVMFENLTIEQTNAIKSELESIQNVESVTIETKNENTLFVLKVPFSSDSTEASTVYQTVNNTYNNAQTGGDITTKNQPLIPLLLMILAISIMIVILLLLCQSWIEPFLFIITIGIAIFINLGTNIIFDNVSVITNSISSLLQLCLSMDFAIILMNRYRQEKPNAENNKIAMKNAIKNSLKSIFGSSFTTIVGMLVLLFMSFTIGMEMGLVLAKGVLLSFLCVFCVLPALIILFDKVIEKTSKKFLHFNMNKLGSFSFKARKIVPFVFIIIFGLSFFIRGGVGFDYTIPIMNNVDKIFEDKNIIVLIYNNEDEEHIGEILPLILLNSEVESAEGYATTIGARLSSEEFAYTSELDLGFVDSLYNEYFSEFGLSDDNKIPIYNFIIFLNEIAKTDPTFGGMIPNEYAEQFAEQLQNLKIQVETAYATFVGENHSRLIITSTLQRESESTLEFFETLQGAMDLNFESNFYFVGNSSMAYEMNDKMNWELTLITILTIIAILIILALTFRSILLPIILVCIIQCAIFLTMGALGLFGGNLYFLAVLIVQALLMGATIDYGILYSTYYKEGRNSLDVIESTKFAYNKSIHTILTSSLILLIVTGIIGLISNDATISQVCLSISIGTFCSATLILFALPPILACFDKFITKKKDIKYEKSNKFNKTKKRLKKTSNDTL